MAHVYPIEFAQTIREIWTSRLDLGEESVVIEEPASSAAWLTLLDLEVLLSTGYQAGLQRDENRVINFRLIYCPPSAFDGLKSYRVMLFERPRAFSDEELRRLAPATDFYRSLIGVHRGNEGELLIWGLIHSGPEWVQVISGGRGRFTPLPNWPVISVMSPGRMSVARGSFTLATLHSGVVARPTLDVFDSEWFPAFFVDARHEISRLHAQRVRESGGGYHQISENLTKSLGQHALRRTISLMRQSRHGGMLIFMGQPDKNLEKPKNGAEEISPLLKVKYAFSERDSRLQFRWALLDILHFLACDYRPSEPIVDALSWAHYVEVNDERLETFDQRLFEFAHLVSELSRVDGAVVMSHRFELLGFGAEIAQNVVQGADPVADQATDLAHVMRALDADATKLQLESTENFGTRHRSAFRFCERDPNALIVVISQDGTVFMVKNHLGRVTYWDQIAISALDI